MTKIHLIMFNDAMNFRVYQSSRERSTQNEAPQQDILDVWVLKNEYFAQ
jgi:hypothetical protein